ncbi:MAG: transketolase [Myxococcaceae bacterium]
MIEQSINTIRTLSMDGVQKANSGHPGTPMALAPVAYTLWQKILRYDPQNPTWFNRDRFILSNGHASMLLYALLYLAQVKDSVTLDDIKAFRQLGSKCPGHPEYGHTVGVEVTTGPLGQGLANSVGIALASLWQAQYFNKPGHEMIDYRVYAICGDGCMMEGISSEAASLAGHLQLPNLCWIYDNNHITIEGSTKLAFSEEVGGRFKAYGWFVQHVIDANDLNAIEQALKAAGQQKKPCLIILDSHIGYGAPNKQDTAAAHGEPLGADEIKLAKKFYGWPEDAQFLVPDGVLEDFKLGIGNRGGTLFDAWQEKFKVYQAAYPELAEQLLQMQSGELPKDWDAELPVFAADPKGMAGRIASSKVLNAIAKKVPWFVGGSADLAPSTKTLIEKEPSLEPSNLGARNLHFGIREHAMGAVLNGLSVSKMRPYGSTFFTFSDYLKPSLRLSALMHTHAVYIFTHDSIGVGEDGPTHQPIEHLMALRAIPHLLVMRPADANEVTEAWRVLMQEPTPCALMLTRQNLPTFDRTNLGAACGVAQGAYILADSPKPQVILIGTGSEVSLCMDAYELLKKENVSARVVSMPSWELFARQPQVYRDSVLPPMILARVAVEAGATLGWERYVGMNGAVLGMTDFGQSAPLPDLLKHFGFTAEHIGELAHEQIKKNSAGV